MIKDFADFVQALMQASDAETAQALIEANEKRFGKHPQWADLLHHAAQQFAPHAPAAGDLDQLLQSIRRAAVMVTEAIDTYYGNRQEREG